jgi:hypothetical protein
MGVVVVSVLPALYTGVRGTGIFSDRPELQFAAVARLALHPQGHKKCTTNMCIFLPLIFLYILNLFQIIVRLTFLTLCLTPRLIQKFHFFLLWLALLTKSSSRIT